MRVTGEPGERLPKARSHQGLLGHQELEREEGPPPDALRGSLLAGKLRSDF